MLYQTKGLWFITEPLVKVAKPLPLPDGTLSKVLGFYVAGIAVTSEKAQGAKEAEHYYLHRDGTWGDNQARGDKYTGYFPTYDDAHQTFSKISGLIQHHAEYVPGKSDVPYSIGYARWCENLRKSVLH
jgi:hypothetical protein